MAKQVICFPLLAKSIKFFLLGERLKNILNYYIGCKRWQRARNSQKGSRLSNLTEPLYIEGNEEYGQKQKCPSDP